MVLKGFQVSADSTARERSPAAAWHAFGHAIAAASGALVALIGCLAHVAPWVASLRGAATWAAALLVVRLAHRALARGGRPAERARR